MRLMSDAGRRSGVGRRACRGVVGRSGVGRWARRGFGGRSVGGRGKYGGVPSVFRGRAVPGGRAPERGHSIRGNQILRKIENHDNATDEKMIFARFLLGVISGTQFGLSGVDPAMAAGAERAGRRRGGRFGVVRSVGRSSVGRRRAVGRRAVVGRSSSGGRRGGSVGFCLLGV